MPKTLLIFNQKGGVGKSSSVVCIAGQLSKNGKKVLVCDVDSQKTSTSFLTVISGEPKYSVMDLINKTHTPEEVVVNISFSTWNNKRKTYTPQKTNIYLLPSSKDINNEDFRHGFDDFDFFVNLFKDEFFNTFDYIIFDCPGYISDLTECALRTTDYLLVPSFADLDSLQGFGDIISTRQRIMMECEKDLQILGVFFTSVSGSSVNKQIIELTRENLGETLLFKSTIRRSAAMLDARVLGKPLIYYKPRIAITQDYKNLVKEIEEKIKEREEK